MENTSRFDNHLIDNRQVRIFLSSTFSDMQEERDALIKTFEMLKIEAAKRNVSLSVVDLRWGVTEEESKSGKVISVCLEEIEHSHPFFIGILGNNYGTAPKREELKKNPELLDRYKWLDSAISDDEEKGMSITEMEIQYGVLDNNNDIDAAFFFKEVGKPDNNKRLTTLKKTLREKYDPKHQNNFTTSSELCNKVAKAVRRVIDKHFPETKEVTLLDRERSAQKAYINSRHSCYFPRKSYFKSIDEFVKSDEQYLVFTGDSGIGKSALLANWIKNNEHNQDFNLVYHFVGNSFSGNSYENILRHLCDEICDFYSIDKRGDDNETIEEETQRLVAEIYSKDKPLVVVIDGINQIVTLGEGREKLLLWLPLANKNVKFIFSTLPDDETWVTFKRREYHMIEVKSLTKKERRMWIPKYLKRVGKKLEEKRQDNIPSQLERIANAAICENTLVLKTLLDELTCFGVHKELDNRINYYLSATSIPDFFDKVLQRMEKDYSEEFVRHALSLIAVSEHGLSEDELLDILDLKQRPLEWHLLFCAVYNHFVVKNGLITFSHHYIADAIYKRYHIDNIEVTSQYRNEILTGFKSNNIEPKDDYDIHRLISEFAHQYFHLYDLQNLYLVLICQGTFNYFYENNQALLAKYWRVLTEDTASNYSLATYLYINGVEKDKPLDLFYTHVAFFIEDYLPSKDSYLLAIEYHRAALSIRSRLSKSDKLQIAQSVNNIGSLYDSLGNCYSALGCYLYSLDIKKEIFGDWHPEIAISYDNIGFTYREMNEMSIAEEYHFIAKTIKEDILGYNHLSTAITYNNLGANYFAKGNMNVCGHDSEDDYSNAIKYFKKAYAIEATCLGDKSQRALATLDGLGAAYQGVGNYLLARDCHMQALVSYTDLYGEDHPDVARIYRNLGQLFCRMASKITLEKNTSKQKLYNNAKEYYETAYRILKEKLGEDNHETLDTKRWIDVINEIIGE